MKLLEIDSSQINERSELGANVNADIVTDRKQITARVSLNNMNVKIDNNVSERYRELVSKLTPEQHKILAEMVEDERTEIIFNNKTQKDEDDITELADAFYYMVIALLNQIAREKEQQAEQFLRKVATLVDQIKTQAGENNES